MKNIIEWLAAKFYDRLIKDAEEKCLHEWRQTLLQDVSCDVLELGCGTGANLEFYSNKVNRLILLEPSIYMQEQLKPKLSKCKVKNIQIISEKAENIPIADNSIDTVVCTLVLCTVANLQKSLSEIHRILRPNGKLYFIEHVAAENNPKRYQWQRRLKFIWKYIAVGCDPTRHTENAMIAAGFKLIEIAHQSIRGLPPIVRPSIRGIAQKI